jgi:hypothetical protein
LHELSIRRFQLDIIEAKIGSTLIEPLSKMGSSFSDNLARAAGGSLLN